MKGRLTKFLILAAIALVSSTSWALDDDPQKASHKKLPLKVQTQGLKLIVNTDSDDTLVYDKILEDTLIFEDEKSGDDTLIFADDEGSMRGKISGSSPSSKNYLQYAIHTESLNPLIYPNPSSGSSMLEFNTPYLSPTEIIITSKEGLLIAQYTTQSQRFELTNIAAGSYIITIKNQNQTIQKRWVVH